MTELSFSLGLTAEIGQVTLSQSSFAGWDLGLHALGCTKSQREGGRLSSILAVDFGKLLSVETFSLLQRF